ncbi:MAG: hypothetical protein RLZ94_312 [Actinomycetota bacterium]
MRGGLGTGWEEPARPNETTCGERTHADSVGRTAASYRVDERDDRTRLLGIDGEVRIRELLQEFLKSQGSGSIAEAHGPHLLPGAVTHEAAPVCGAFQVRIVMHHGDTVARGAYVGFEIRETQGGRVPEGR